MDLIDDMLTQWRAERPDLDVEALGVTLRIEMLAKKLRRAASARLSEVGLKIWEYEVLAALRRQGDPHVLPASELAGTAMLTPGAMTNRIDQLELKGLVARLPDPNDRRGVLVNLTATGRELVDQAIGLRLSAAESVIEHLDNNQRRSAEQLLQVMLESLDRRSA